MVIESQALAQKRTQEGYTYQQERGFDVAEKVAENKRLVSSPIWALVLEQWQVLAVLLVVW